MENTKIESREYYSSNNIPNSIRSKQILSEIEISKTGDLILVSGRGVLSPAIMVMQYVYGSILNDISMRKSIYLSQWTHCGIIFVDKYGKFNSKEKGAKYVIEAIFSINDVGGEKRNGISVTRLDERMKKYKYPVTFMHLNKSVDLININGKNGTEIIYDFWKKHKDAPFELDFVIQIFKDKDNFDKFYCSELVAAFYRELRLFNKDFKTNKTAPMDFFRIKLNDGFDLKNRIEIQNPNLYYKLMKNKIINSLKNKNLSTNLLSSSLHSLKFKNWNVMSKNKNKNKVIINVSEQVNIYNTILNNWFKFNYFSTVIPLNNNNKNIKRKKSINKYKYKYKQILKIY